MRGKLPQAPRRTTGVVWLSLFAALLCSVLFASSASATVMKYADVEQLIEISEVVVHAEVVDQTTYFDEDQDRVVTDTSLSVKRVFWGKPDKQLTIQQWGGTYDGKTHFVPGDARFEQGEEVIVFLHEGDGVIALSALGQAKFSVETISQKKLVTRDLSDIAFLLDKPGGPKVEHRPSETRSYESFVAELESLIAGIKGGDRE